MKIHIAILVDKNRRYADGSRVIQRGSKKEESGRLEQRNEENNKKERKNKTVEDKQI